MAASTTPEPEVYSVTEASLRGVARLVKDAESGAELIVERHGTPVAALVSIERFHHYRAIEEELRDLALITARVLTDDGTRVSLDDAIRAFGFDRSELEAELDAELADQR
jgi:prevent-host-death family protein